MNREDFYPFGATFNSYSRENSVPNKYLYNKGSELVDDLGVQIYLTDLREYDPWGRLGWWQVDSKADLAGQESWTPYHYAFNNPIRYNDPKGDCPPDKPNCKEPDVKASGPYAESSKGTAQAGVARVNLQAKDGKEQVNVNVTVVGGTATAKGDTKNGLTGQAKAEAKGLAMDATYKVGSDKNNAQGTIDARLGTADARAKGSLTLAGASVGLGAGAAVGSAEGKGSVTLFGVTLEVSGLVTGGSAHAGLEATLQPFGGSGKSAIAVKADLGLGAGGGLGISISW
ncbi:MAG: hypothetical protein JST37_09530 [Bacteroidetes bacterium]|nr:hypothetical protein [Bacteroidota bacterium]